METNIFIDLLGWVSAITVVLGFALNAKRYHLYAMILWIVGDVMWIVYDYLISNWSHAFLSTVIIATNIYGIYNRPKFKPMSKRQMKHYIDLFE